MQQALEWIYTAGIFDANEASRGGPVRSIHSVDTLLNEAEVFTRRLVQGRSPVAIALSRQMFYRNSAQAHRIESLAMFYTRIGGGKEGVAAFLDKRLTLPQSCLRSTRSGQALVPIGKAKGY